MVYEQRLQQFQQHIADHIDLAFFPISADLQYLTGVPRDTPNFGAVLHPGMWLEGVWITPNHAPVVTLPRMTAEFGGLDQMDSINLRVLGDHDDPAALLKEILTPFKLPNNPRVAIGDSSRGETAIALQAILPDAKFSSATTLLNPMRRVKTKLEIATMKKAGEITEQAFAATVSQLQHGITELEIITELNYQLRAHGSMGPSFVTSMYNSGPNLPLVFGHREERWHRPLIAPVALLFDFGAIYDGYCYDYGRTISFGEPTDELTNIFELVMTSQKAGIEALEEGATAESVDAAARQVIIDGGFGAEFRHRLGHGIGLDVHEAPFLTQGDDTILEEGMLFTIEPSITQFNTFSARVEDVVEVGKHGGKPLTSGHQDFFVVD